MVRNSVINGFIESAVKAATENCRKNFERSGQLVMGELLYLWLTKAGMPDAKKFVNEKVVPFMNDYSCHFTINGTMELLSNNPEAKAAWEKIPAEAKTMFLCPERYIRHAAEIALTEAENELVFD